LFNNCCSDTTEIILFHWEAFRSLIFQLHIIFPKLPVNVSPLFWIKQPSLDVSTSSFMIEHWLHGCCWWPTHLWSCPTFWKEHSEMFWLAKMPNSFVAATRSMMTMLSSLTLCLPVISNSSENKFGFKCQNSTRHFFN